MTIKIKLKPCPFCGGVADYGIQDCVGMSGHGESSDEVLIMCRQCNAKQSDYYYSGAKHVERARAVIKRWNRRPTPEGFKP